MKKLAIVVALCSLLVCSPVHAKTFVGVLYPLFGPGAAIGLVELVDELKMMPDVEVSTYLHQSWPSLVEDIDRQPPGTHIVVIGYSLGANNSVLVANQANYVDLIIALQPSMLTSTPPVSKKVGRMIEIYNPNPWMTFGGMGSQKLVGENIEYIENNDSHPGAQFNPEFRNLVKTDIAKLTTDDQLEAGQAEIPQPLRRAQLPLSAGLKPAKERLTYQQSQIPKAEMPSLPPPKPIRCGGAAETAAKRLNSFFRGAFDSENSQEMFVQRQLTIRDMKDYVHEPTVVHCQLTLCQQPPISGGVGERVAGRKLHRGRYDRLFLAKSTLAYCRFPISLIGQSLHFCDVRLASAYPDSDRPADISRGPLRANTRLQPLFEMREAAISWRPRAAHVDFNRYYFRAVETLLKVVFRLVPRVCTATMIATAMPAAIRPYSIAVAPD